MPQTRPLASPPRETGPELAALRRAVQEQATPGARVARITLRGRSYWVKRREVLPLRWRLQKGDPARAFERERRAYRALGGRDLPLATCVDEGPDYLVIRDAGAPLSRLMRDESLPAADRAAALDAAAAALHRLHAADAAHGRPNLKDILWDGTEIAFIDLERCRKPRRLARAQALDLLMFAFSCLAVADARLPEIDHALAVYRMLDSGAIWPRAVRMLWWLRGLVWALAPLRRLRRSRELRAIPRLFETFARH